MPPDYREEPDVQLMLRVRDGDQDAFARLIEKHQRGILNAAYRYVGDATEAEDLAQEVFIKVWKARDRYEPTAKFTTWLYHIATNLCLNEVRDRARHKVVMLVPDEKLEGAAGGDTERPTKQVRQNEMAEEVRDAIESLPSAQRMAVILDKFQGFTDQEIGDAMGLSVPAVKSLLFRARDNLRKRLEKYVRG